MIMEYIQKYDTFMGKSKVMTKLHLLAAIVCVGVCLPIILAITVIVDTYDKIRGKGSCDDVKYCSVF